MKMFEFLYSLLLGPHTHVLQDVCQAFKLKKVN